MATSLQTNEAFDAIDESRTVAELERAVIEAAQSVIDADAYGITWLDRACRKKSARTVNVPMGFVEEYEAFGRDRDSLFTHMVRRREAVHDRALHAPREWLQEPVSAFLHDWGFDRCMQAPVIVDGVLQGTLHFTRRQRARAFVARDLRAAQLLDVRAARQLRCILVERELDQTRKLCSSLLEHLPIPAAVTTPSSTLVHVNQAASMMLVSYRASPALWPEYEAAVTANIAAIAASGTDEGGVLAGRRECDELEYKVNTNPVNGGGGNLFLSLFHPARCEVRESATLAARERVIAGLVAQGYTNERIGFALNLSVNTVKDHLKRINRKLGTTNRAQIAAWAQVALAGRDVHRAG